MLFKDADELIVPLSELVFRQSYVKRSVVEAKKIIRHLRFKYGDQWRDHISELSGLHLNIQRELTIVDLELPIWVSRHPTENLYIVSNGVHTCYAFWGSGYSKIPAKPDPNSYAKENLPRLYRFEEIRVEDD